MRSLCCVAGAVLCVVASLTPVAILGQEQEARNLIRTVVKSELTAHAQDSSRWMFRDSNKSSG
jgi:hypothetical protein